MKFKVTLTIALFLTFLCIVGITFLAIKFSSGKIDQKKFIIQLAQYTILVMCIFLPLVLEQCHFTVGTVIWISFYVFVFLSIYVGSIINLYDKFLYFDVIVHILGGAFAALFALALSRSIDSKFLRMLFCLGFAMLVGVLWEFYEFSFDRLLGLNMQRTSSPLTNSPYVGWHAISDTILDLFCDFCGGLFASALCLTKLANASSFLIIKK